jgi:hypothetical protein
MQGPPAGSSDRNGRAFIPFQQQHIPRGYIMSHTIRLSVLAVAMAAAFSLATLMPTASNEVQAQGIQVRGITNGYYNGHGGSYYSGYSNGYSRHGSGSFRYYGYGNGPYIYRSPSLYSYPSTGNYGYRSGVPSNQYYRGVRSYSGTHHRVYSPYSFRFYSPFGIGGY